MDSSRPLAYTHTRAGMTLLCLAGHEQGPDGRHKSLHLLRDVSPCPIRGGGESSKYSAQLGHGREQWMNEG